MTKSKAKEEKAADLERSYHKPKVLFWDIESTGLNSGFGTILCIGYKWQGDKKPAVFSILDGKKKSMLDDKKVVENFASVFAQCDYHVTWYGKRFDLPMVRSKLLEHGLPPIAPKPHVDLWEPARRLFKLHNNRLGTWATYIGAEHAKTPLDFAVWKRAAHGDKQALAYIVTHCEADVNVLEETFNRLKPWIENIPNTAQFTGEPESCPSCGSGEFTRQGYRTSLTRTYQQYRCKKCFHWFNGSTSIGGTRFRSSPL